MSRAFVRESDQDPDELLPDRAISPHTNFVTPDGLQQIEARVRELEAARQAARAQQNAPAVARHARDLRYWRQRQASAKVVEPLQDPQAVRFGVRVTLHFDDGTEQTFRIVGEDEANPSQALLSWTSPLAKAAMGAVPGDVLNVLDREAEVFRIES
jgi:transcription elongation GreA/GreB family factor